MFAEGKFTKLSENINYLCLILFKRMIKNDIR